MYDIVLLIWAIAYIPILLLKGRLHKDFKQRFGIFPDEVANRCKNGCVWLHAVSVGEVAAAAPLLRRLREEFPDELIVISTVTKTGNQMAQKLKPENALLIYFPIDFAFVVKKAIDAIKPKIFIMMETEIWPNLVRALSRRGTPILLMNGRLSVRSYRGYRLAKPFIRRVARKMDLFCMQNEDDAARIISLGAPRDRVKVTGNMKFDVEIPTDNLPKKDSEDDLVFVAGSTHGHEEEIIFWAYDQLHKNYPKLKLIVAPRHVERAKEVEQLAHKCGLESRVMSKDHPIKPDVLVLDAIGQLSRFYSIADIVFVGGSLIPHGGQNLLEPAAFAKPIITGPYTFNFHDIIKMFKKNQALTVVRDGYEMLAAGKKLLADTKLRKRMGQAGRGVFDTHRGAAKRNLDLVKQFLTK